MMKRLFGEARGGRSGQSLISAVVGTGVAMVGLAAVATMINYSQKAGKSAQGLSEAGLLTDSIRSIVSDSSRCQQAFRVTPAGGGAPVAPVLATDGASVSISSIGMMSGGTFTPYATAGQSFGSPFPETPEHFAVFRGFSVHAYTGLLWHMYQFRHSRRR